MLLNSLSRTLTPVSAKWFVMKIKTIIVNNFHPHILLLVLLIKTQEQPRFRPINATYVFWFNKLRKRKNENNTYPYLHVYFPVFLKSRTGNRYLCFLSRSANNCRLSHHKHGGRGLYKLSREKPTGIHNRKKPLPCKPILLGLKSKFPLKQLCILNAAGSLVWCQIRMRFNIAVWENISRPLQGWNAYLCAKLRTAVVRFFFFFLGGTLTVQSRHKRHRWLVQTFPIQIPTNYHCRN